MKSVVAFVGSRKGINSDTYKYTKLLLDKLTERYKEIQYEIITPDKYNIKPCLSCNNCFFHGSCNQDKQDDMGKVKEKMIKADLIVFGSPVFAHNVSGDMKTFIDRVSYWLHIFKLSNKRSISISMSSTNGNVYVGGYLKYILESFGSDNILNIDITNGGPNLLKDKEFMEQEMDKYVELICEKLDSDVFISNDIQEQLFQTFKETIPKRTKENAESLYWENSGLSGCENFQEYLIKNI